ncbi:cytochrome P450 [Pseudosulfitobacter koreensis]|uniref:Cytochrome P450 n=1 Tax=Pseudosulfitobacter koreensis TaxID=2968472 RepID=A0ABT1YXC7_9RHOB|nr:cytochrome P450 [Pseudosulfitobacter koreense]MCR8825544.1 cytochrome P450 [Pseudosulfitobacter koreense]
MSDAPVTHIDLADFAADPYPALARMRAETPVTYVPELGATLLTRRDDIHTQEKRTEVFSSRQPDGLMTRLMGENMMRKDGDAHMAERRALFPALSPRTVQEHWKPIFEAAAQYHIKRLVPRGTCNLVTDFAMPVAASALKAITGLEAMTDAEMDGVSQAMIDGCANYAGDKGIESRCKRATRFIDDHISDATEGPPARSALQVMTDAGLPPDSIRANIKLIISGGQNEPRDAIAGTVWALLKHPSQLAMILDGRATWGDAFAEYARWISPIGMSPRRVERADTVLGVTFEPEDRVFLMYGSANRDEAHFALPDTFDITRSTQSAISFGAGPHFCAGAAAARCLITEVALPLAFAELKNLRLAGDAPFAGWAFRGPVKMPVKWDT